MPKLYSEGVKTVYIEAKRRVRGHGRRSSRPTARWRSSTRTCTSPPLGPDASLNMELTLSHGRGYVPADKNKPAQTIIGVIPVDSIYTPVRKVNYTVENTRVGDATDYDKLTPGGVDRRTISARDAVSWVPASSAITSPCSPT